MPNTFNFNYMFDKASDAAASLHAVEITIETIGTKTKITINVWDGANSAELKGEMTGTTAFIMNAAARRFPGGKRVGYFMVNLFAREVERLSAAASVMLGTPINHDNNRRAEASDPGSVDGEKGAAHVYEQCGFDVTDAITASTCSVPVATLITNTDPKIGDWKSLPTG